MKSISTAIMFSAIMNAFLTVGSTAKGPALILGLVLCVLFVFWLIIMFKKER